MLTFCVAGIAVSVLILVAAGPIHDNSAAKVSANTADKPHASALAISSSTGQAFNQSSSATSAYSVQGPSQPADSEPVSQTLSVPIAPTGDYTPSDNIVYPIKNHVCKFYIDSFSDPDVCPSCIDGSSAVSACGCGGSKFEMVCMAP